MRTLFGSALALSLALGLGGPASAQSPRCTHDALTVDATPVSASFCVPAGGAAPSVTVSESFTAAGKTLNRSVTLVVVAGAVTSRTIDDVDLSSIGPKRTLHMTLAFRAGSASLEHALALPGAVPVK